MESVFFIPRLLLWLGLLLWQEWQLSGQEIERFKKTILMIFKRVTARRAPVTLQAWLQFPTPKRGHPPLSFQNLKEAFLPQKEMLYRQEDNTDFVSIWISCSQQLDSEYPTHYLLESPPGALWHFQILPVGILLRAALFNHASRTLHRALPVDGRIFYSLSLKRSSDLSSLLVEFLLTLPNSEKASSLLPSATLSMLHFEYCM